MNKNDREKKLLYEWSIQNTEGYCFDSINKEKNSYFVKRDADMNSYIREYSFEILPELTVKLDTLWENDEVMNQIKKIIAIAALKNKPLRVITEDIRTGHSEKKSGMETEDKLPAFIYNF